MQRVLAFMYSDVWTPPSSDEALLDELVAADKYGVARLKVVLCEANAVVTLENCMEVLVLADMVHAMLLYEAWERDYDKATADQPQSNPAKLTLVVPFVFLAASAVSFAHVSAQLPQLGSYIPAINAVVFVALCAYCFRDLLHCSAVASSTKDPTDRIKIWKKQIHDYIQASGSTYDRSDLARRIVPLARPVAAILVHVHPLAVQEGFEFITSVVTEVGLPHIRPLLVAVITSLIHDTKCSQSQCIASVARFAIFDVTCIAECFVPHIALDGRMRQMYYHVLRTVVDGPSALLLMEMDQYDMLLHVILECLEHFRDPLRQQMAVVMQVALDHEHLLVLWRSHWDVATKRRYVAAMPDSRRLAKLWAPKKRRAQERLPLRRHFSEIGKKALDESDLLSSIHHDDDDGNDVRHSTNEDTIDQINSTKQMATIQNDLHDEVHRFYNMGGLMWMLVMASVLFGICGVLHAVLVYAQDFEAWKVRIALSDYQVSLDRCEREIQRVTWQLETMARDPVDQSHEWTQDHATAKAISTAWQAIHDQVDIQPK
ncbi:hypothetical protein DYB34_010735 [Aphanomyces astaci]|uniref:BTB domain-containing protein n=1 Tax=Aphanomyces astaci TaxID=112090 RepID=A0A418BS72_APHAT|nr:hypothetical protein DYB34_010735 [Aphanomyces astaci]